MERGRGPVSTWTTVNRYWKSWSDDPDGCEHLGVCPPRRYGRPRAYLLVGGGHPIWEEAIESLVNPRQSEMEQMIEPRFTPAHPHPFEALLDQPFTGTFH